MNNKKQKKAIIGILVLLIIFGLVLVILDKTLFSDDTNIDNPSSSTTPNNPPTSDTPSVDNNYISFGILKDASEFYTVSKSIDNYLNYIYEQNYEATYNILSKKYTSNNGINTTNSLVESIPRNNPISYTATKIYSYDYDDYISAYYVYGEITTDTTFDPNSKSETINTYHLVIMDAENNIFNVTPIKSENEIEEKRTTTKKSDLDTNITKNTYNTFKFQNISNDTLVSTYYYRFLDKLMYNQEEAYSMLNENYKEQRFGDYQKFLTYINANINDIGSSTITSYRLVSSLNNIYYIYNNNGDVFVFVENGIMQFEVYLDDKTVNI